MSKMTIRVALRQNGGSCILTIPKEIAKSFGNARTVIIQQDESGVVTIRPEFEDIDVLAALNQLDYDTVKRMSDDTSWEDLSPAGNEIW